MAATHGGAALSFDQEVAPDLVPFFRYGYAHPETGEDQHFVSGGVGFENPLGRELDLLAVGAAWQHQGDGSDETLLEAFYRIQVTRTVGLTPDVQVILNPANGDDELVFVAGARLQLTF